MNNGLCNFFTRVSFLLLLSGCAKKQRIRLPLPKITHVTYKQVNHDVKLTIGTLAAAEFEKIYPRGLGKYTIVDCSDINTTHGTTDNNSVYMLQGCIKNNSTAAIYISRESISLPIIPVKYAYHKGIFEQVAASLLLIGGMMVFPVGLALSVPTGGVLCTASIANLILWLPLGIVSIVPGAVLIPIEHLKYVDRKNFVYGVMLPEGLYKIEPQTEFNWFMLVPVNEYEVPFMVTCTNKDGIATSTFNVTHAIRS